MALDAISQRHQHAKFQLPYPSSSSPSRARCGLDIDTDVRHPAVINVGNPSKCLISRTIDIQGVHTRILALIEEVRHRCTLAEVLRVPGGAAVDDLDDGATRGEGLGTPTNVAVGGDFVAGVFSARAA